MVRVLLVGVVVLSGCTRTLFFPSIIEAARQNEVSAVADAVDQRVLVTGTVLDISFERPKSTDLVVTPTRISTEDVTIASPYADLETEAGPVRCLFANDHARRLSKGSRVTLRCWFSSLHRKQDRIAVRLDFCAIEE